MGIDHRAPEQVFGVEHLAHLGPDGEKVSREGFPDRFVEGVGGGATVFAWDAGGEVVLGGGGLRGLDGAGEGGAGCCVG